MNRYAQQILSLLFILIFALFYETRCYTHIQIHTHTNKQTKNSHSLKRTYIHTHTHTLSLSLTHTHTYIHTHTHTHSLSLSLSAFNVGRTFLCLSNSRKSFCFGVVIIIHLIFISLSFFILFISPSLLNIYSYCIFLILIPMKTDFLCVSSCLTSS